MDCNKIIILTFVLFIVFLITLKTEFETFQTTTSVPEQTTIAVPEQTFPIESVTNIKTDLMNVKVNLEESTINLDSHTTDKNINVGNSIIIKNSFNIDGYDSPIDINFLRYIKHLPLIFEKEICLSDNYGSSEDSAMTASSTRSSEDCINQKHIEILKGDRKINLVTYPQNYRKCLGAKNIIHKKTINEAPSDHKVFSSNKCKKGTHINDFVILRLI